MDVRVSAKEMKRRQSWDLETKIEYSLSKIDDFDKINDGKTYVAFSGGKDSTVLLDLVRKVNPETPGVFSDTGLEFPEIKEFVNSMENITIIRPDMTFLQVIEKHGWPVISKVVAMSISRYRVTKKEVVKEYRLYGTRNGVFCGKAGVIPQKYRYLVNAPFKISESCCDVLKKRPFKRYNKKSGRRPYIGTMASDSKLRELDYIKRGCNIYEGNIASRPISIWNNDDIWDYIHKNNLRYSNIYDMGYHNTGCIYCMFGIMQDKEPNRFQLLKKTHPGLHNYVINTLNAKEVLDYIGIKYE